MRVKRNSPSDVPDGCPLKTKVKAVAHITDKIKKLRIDFPSYDMECMKLESCSTSLMVEHERVCKKKFETMDTNCDEFDEPEEEFKENVFSTLLMVNSKLTDYVERAVSNFHSLHRRYIDPPGMTLALYREPRPWFSELEKAIKQRRRP